MDRQKGKRFEMTEKLIFISCGQQTAEEKDLGTSVKQLVDSIPGFTAYFAEYVQSLDALARNIFEGLLKCSGLISFLHERGLVTTEGNKEWGHRSSVWVNQEIAILAFRKQLQEIDIPIIVFKDERVRLEGAMTSLIVNPIRMGSRSDILVEIDRWLKSTEFPEPNTYNEDAVIERLSDLYVLDESGSRSGTYHKVSLVPYEKLDFRLERASERKFEQLVTKEFYSDRKYIGSCYSRDARYYQIEVLKTEVQKKEVACHRIWRLYSYGAVEFISQIGKGVPRRENLGDMILDLISIIKIYRTLLQEKGYSGKSYFRHEIHVVERTELLPRYPAFRDVDDYDEMQGIRLERDTIDSKVHPNENTVTEHLQSSDIKSPNRQIADSFLKHLRAIFQARVDFNKFLEIVDHLDHLE